MAKKKKTTDPYEVEMLDLLNEVGGQMVIKYHTIILRPTKDKLENIRKAGYPTDVMTCIMFGLAASFKDQKKVLAYIQEAEAAGAAPTVTFEAAEGEALNITGKENNPMVDAMVQAISNNL